MLPPDAKVTYTMHAEIFSGEWQNGLQKNVQGQILFDLDKFDNTLYERSDLAWIREATSLYSRWHGTGSFMTETT